MMTVQPLQGETARDPTAREADDPRDCRSPVSARTSLSSSMLASSSRHSRSPTTPTARSMPNAPTRSWCATRSPAISTSPASIRSPVRTAGGRPWSARASRSTPSAISSSARTWSAPAWAQPARPRPIRRRTSPGAWSFPSSPSATWCAQAMLLDHLGIKTLFSVAGGSMGGMQVLQWAASYPERVFSALPIACATRHSAQNIAFHEVGRQAIMADPDGAVAAIFWKTPIRAAASRSRAWARTSRICPTPPCTGNWPQIPGP